MTDFPDIVEAPLRARFVSLGLQPGDVEERFVRGSGAGGQKINKTSSTVWLRHQPTGLEVRCQRERSQAVNRALAWQELCNKLAAWQRAGAARAEQERQQDRRRRRQKSRGQKLRMVEAKRHRAGVKERRRRAEWD